MELLKGKVALLAGSKCGIGCGIPVQMAGLFAWSPI